MNKLKGLKTIAVVGMISCATMALAETRHIYNDSNHPWYVDTHWEEKPNDRGVAIKNCITDPNVSGRWCLIPPKQNIEVEYFSWSKQGILSHYSSCGRVSIMDKKGKINSFKLYSDRYSCHYSASVNNKSKRVLFNSPVDRDVVIKEWAEDWG